MIQTGFEPRVKVQEIIANQLPSFILDENPKAVDFFKQYYISQEYQGGTSDLSENLDQYLKVDNLIPEVVVDSTRSVGIVTTGDTTINVTSTIGYPDTYGLLKIDSEIITYTGKTATSFTGCVRGFSGITSYHQDNNQEELVFSTSLAAEHADDSSVQNLSTLFLKEFYNKLKATFTPGLENVDFAPEINAGNFIKEARSLYESKGTDDSFKILCKVLYAVDPTIVNLENYLIKPSSAQYIRRFVTIAEVIDGNPNNLVGQQITKLTDSGTNASISEVEPFTRNNKQYFKISLFIGYDDLSTVEGTFNITPSTRSLELVSIGSSIIPVDSTIGFGQTGTIVSGTNTISYTDKTINQFLGVTGIGVSIQATDNIRSNEIYFGYENGDPDKMVTLRLTGVLSEFNQISEKLNVKVGDTISVKNLGSNIKNPSTDKNYKQIFANSWIYNTSSRYQIDDVSNFTLSSPIDRSSLKEGDRVEILQRDSQEIESSETNIAHVDAVLTSQNRVTLDNLTFTAATGQEYDLRRKLNTASSSNVPMLYGNNILSDVLNVYDEDSKFSYVASNSLPSSNKTSTTTIDYAYEITKDVNSASITEGTVGILTDIQSDGKFKTIKFANEVPFIEGDRIFYEPETAPLVGLETGSYFVSIVSADKKRISLYSSRSFVGGPNYLKFGPEANGHNFTLFSQRSKTIGPQKVLKKFTLEPNIKNGMGENTIPGTTGMLINGVEISNYKSDDMIYFGPLDHIKLLNGGSGFDVINLPNITATTGIGTTALIQPVVSGSVKKVYVDPQNFDIDRIVSIGITGGNGSGAVLEANLADRFRNIFFDARLSNAGGGINSITDQIVFQTDHNLVEGEEIIYSNENNTSVGVGTTTATLVDKASYFAKIDNNRTIQLFESESDFNSGINTVNITSAGNGIQKFSPANSKKTITNITVIDGGTGYTNRNLQIKPVGISTIDHTINFVGHGFVDGDKIEYQNTDGTVWTSPDITGVTTFSYRVLKVDDDSFRLCNTGIGGTDLTQFQQREHVRFETVGTGNHNFKFPDIVVDVKYTSVGFGTTSQTYQNIVATPVVRGSIIDAYLYEAGTGYGSTILNLHKKPLISIKTGKDAQLDPFIVNGKFEQVTVDSNGSEYFSLPDIEINDPSGLGVGGELRPVITNGRLTDVIIVSTGIGYSSDTTLRVKSTGINALFDAEVRNLTVSNKSRFGDELLKETDNNLQYSVLGYFETLRTAFKENSSNVSKIIGWAYDGNPIYGPFGYTDPENTSSSPKRVQSGYTLNTSKIIDRPAGFDAGFFVDDYEFTDSGDLDQYNGRFAKTVEFPEGVYAYYATLDSSNNPQFPYFIGNKYRSNTLPENVSLNQTFDFNSSDLLRNTFPYKVSDNFADNDFIIETNEVVNQKAIVESQSTGSIDNFDIINSGSGYEVGDILNFDTTETGGGLIAKVSRVKGKNIDNINTTVHEFNDSIFTLEDDRTVKVTIAPEHTILDNDSVIISGFSTNLTELNDSFVVGVTSFRTNLTEDISAGTSGVSTEIYVSQIPDNISVDSRLGIGTEVLTVLEVFDNLNIIKVERGVTGLSHTASTTVFFKPDTLTIKSNLEFFDSRVNDKVYFNPVESVGVGTTAGVSNSVSFSFGNSIVTRDIPTRSITLENHPFKNNQRVVFNNGGGSNISISTSPTGSAFNLPTNVFVVDKNINSIGIKTTLSSSEVYFRNNGSDNDKYFFESDFNQIKGNIQKAVTQVSISTFHDLNVGDSINLDVSPNLSVGIGTSTAVRVKRNTVNGNILINPIEFGSASVNPSTNIINLPGHGFKTGDKIDYNADTVATGLSTNTYYVYRVDDNNIQLALTRTSVSSNPPHVVDITGTGGAAQVISPINPKIVSIKNNNLVFDLTDSSLEDYKLKIYYDQYYNNEIVSISTTSSFTIVGVGTVGVSTDASLTINNTESLPRRLYYNLENAGFISTSDTEVSNYSEILFANSSYEGEYVVSPVGLGTTTFNIFLDKIPEKLSYTQNECDVLEYDTSSTTTSGPISKINIISGGSNYEKNPNFTGVTGSNGIDAYIVPTSKDIGNPFTVRVINEGFEYSSDKTLQPTADISPFVTIQDSNTVGFVSVTSGGKNFINAPTITIVNPNTRTKIDSGILRPIITSNAITSVEIEREPKGLTETTVELFTENNTNGVSVQKAQSSSATGIVTCFITTPTIGFSVNPFKVGDEAFIEGLKNTTAGGTGFNSPDIGYRFYTVTGYDSTGAQHKVTLRPPVTSSGAQVFSTTNSGVVLEDQGAIPTLINKDDYPVLVAVQKRSTFLIGENLLVNSIERDLSIASSEESSIKVRGSYEISVGDVLQGVDSGNIATVNEIELGEGLFKVDYSIKKDIGWETDIGKLDFDDQVVADNDYYQNLSYAIKSPLTYKKTTEVVKGLLHTSGMKDFADTGISSTAPAGLGTREEGDKIGDGSGSEDQTSIFKDLLTETRVDTLYDFDLVRDIDVVDDKSKFITFKNKKLTDYIECRTNRVLTIDNINSQFSNLEAEPSDFVNLLKLETGRSYFNNLVRVSNTDNTELQFSNLIILASNNDHFILDQGTVVNRGTDILHNNGEEYGEFNIVTDSQGDNYFRFTPVETANTDYDLKLRTSQFTSSTPGIGTEHVGFIRLTGSNGGTVTNGFTTALYSSPVGKLDALFADVQVIDTSTDEMNFVGVYLTHDGTDTFMSEFYNDTNAANNAISLDEIGEFGANISSGIVTFTYTSDTDNDITLRARIVGFGTTATGIGTYRFKAMGQQDESERSVIYQSDFVDNVSTATTVVSLPNTLFNAAKSFVRVSMGNTSALHQIMTLKDVTEDIYLQQSPFLSIGSTTGIGTFGAEIVSGNMNITFTPDNSDTVDISAFSECFYTDIDSANISQDLIYNSVTDSVGYNFYNARNGDRINRRQFKVTHNNIPIFAKTFNPADAAVVDLATGTFSIDDHFFSDREELIYTPRASFVGVGSTAMQYKTQPTDVADELPETVFAIVSNDDSFQIATTKTGTAVTFTSVGEGNVHMFEMAKRNSKSLIAIDNVAQYPISFTPVNHALSGNGGSVGVGSTFIALAGISSIFPNDVLLIDDEYVIVQNVGLGTTNAGPITNSGTVNLVEVERGAIGSAASTHQDTTGIATVHKGGYNLVGQDIYFTQSPRGNPQVEKTESNLDFPTSDFNGRAYLRQDYTTNQVYDDVSDHFNGITTSFSLSVGGASTAGIGTTGGNGILFINGMFQTPTTVNNPSNNFRIIEDLSAGVSTVRFSGIRDESNNLFTSNADVNVGQLPRGGIVVSLGSTGGLGFAPLDGALTRPIIGAGGSISGVVAGVGTTSAIKQVSDGFSISTATYNNVTGIIEITTNEQHRLTVDAGEVFMEGLEFRCTAEHTGVTTTIFPDGSSPFGQRFPITGIVSDRTFTANAGVCTIPHAYVGMGTIYRWYDTGAGSGYRDGLVSIAVTDLVYEHRFVSAGVNSITDNTSATHTATDASYDSPTGLLTLTIPNHGLDTSNTIGITTGSIVFTCSRDNHLTNHAYPREESLTQRRRGVVAGDPAYNVQLGIQTFTTNTIGVGVGTGGGGGRNATINHTVGAGGTLGFTVGAGGTEYVNPEIFVSEPTYDNLEVIGVSRLGIGATTQTGTGLLLDIEVGASSTTGIGSTTHQVTGFKIARNGFAFEKGDVIKPVGLVTAAHLTSPTSEFELTVTDIFTDNFGLWQFGELDYIDSVKNFQDGSRKRFPLFYNNDLLSFETEDGSDIDLSAALLIMIDGVIQEPGVAYTFEGGTTFAFTAAPLPESQVDIFFYRGTRGSDTILVTSVNQIIEKGDQVQVLKNNAIRTTRSQGKRRVYNLDSSDKIETNIYVDGGINEDDYKPLSLIKQKVDMELNGEQVFKTRDSIEGQIFPAANVIKDFSTTDTEIFLDNTDLFDYDLSSPFSYSMMAVTGIGSTDATNNVEFMSVSNVVNSIQGFSGVVTGITTSQGVGSADLALRFEIIKEASDNFSDLQVGYPIYIHDTVIGNGVTSINDTDAAVVGVGSTFLDNVYIIQSIDVGGNVGVITCNIHSGSSVVGLGTTMNTANPVGKYSWGRLSGITRSSSPISIGVSGHTIPSLNVGISTFPIVQRRGVGLRDNGSLPKQL